MHTAKEIADRFADSDAEASEIELVILRHMEHHVARAVTAERELCAKVAENVDEPGYRVSMRDAKITIARAIRNQKG